MLGRRSKAVSITDAAPSRREELRHREVRYIAMMSTRVVCLILATVLFTAHAPYAVIWGPILLLGVTVLPWFAVILANDRGRKRRPTVPRPTVSQPSTRILTSADTPERRVIDIDP
jgi:hypothetical protein